MTIVDSHCHAGLNWFEPIELLLHQMNANGVNHGVLIQHRGTYDNQYLFECAAQHPGRFAVVGLVDVTQPDAPQALADLAEKGAIGVRFMAEQRWTGPDPLALWSKAAECGLIVSCLGSVEAFASKKFQDLIARFDDLPVVIEHLAGAEPQMPQPYTTYRRALELARYPNTTIKVGGLGEISQRPEVLGPTFAVDNTPPLIEMACETFGPKRMMWGSDYPPVSMREGYRNALQGVSEHPALSRPEDRKWVMRQTALNVFKLADPAAAPD